MGSGWENLKIQLALKGLKTFLRPFNVESQNISDLFFNTKNQEKEPLFIKKRL